MARIRSILVLALVCLALPSMALAQTARDHLICSKVKDRSPKARFQVTVATAAGFQSCMVKTPANPGGLPKEVFDDFQRQLAANRSQFYLDIASGPFYGFNRPGAKVSQALIQNWWRQGMMGSAKAHYDGIVAFSQTDFTEDLKKIRVPVLVMHGDDDQVVPYADSAPLSAKLLAKGVLKTYAGFPHGMPTTEAATINADLLAFVRS